MPRIARSISVLSVALLALLAGCSRDDEPAALGADSGLLQYVDAETPYFFAALEPMPDDVYAKLEPKMDELLDAYRKVIRLSLTERLAEDDAAGEVDIDAEQIGAVIDRIIGSFSSSGMAEAGLSRESQVALYGAGLLPVLRITLDDVAAFERTLQAMEDDAGTGMQTATLGSLTYRYAGDDELRAVIAVVDGQVVASLVPATIGDESLRQVFGLTKPARSIAESGRLDEIAKKYRYTPNGFGVIDIERLAAIFIDAPTGINAELLGMTAHDASQLSDVCKAEIRSIAAIAPRLVTGYTEYTADRMVSNTVLELRPDIAQGLKALPATVPGLGRDQGGLVSFGLSIDLLAAREFYSARLDALEEAPYECELLAGMQDGVAQGRAVLQQPVPPVVYGLKGFLAVIDDIKGMDMASRQPPEELDLRFLLASDNAPGLVAMGSMFSPELATLNLKPDGQAVRFESPQLQAPVEEAWLAMSDSAIALAVGANGAAQATSLLDEAAGTPPPLFAMHMDAGRYYAFVGDAVMQQQDGETSPEMGVAVRDLMQALSGLIDRVSLTVLLTDRGVEMPTVTTLAD